MPGEVIKLSNNADRIVKEWQRLSSRVRRGVELELRRELIRMEGRVKARSGVRFRRGAAGLGGRLTSFVSADSQGLAGAIGFRKTRGFPYELAQEFGAKARAGHAMAIPVSAAAKRAKSPREMDLVMIKRRGRPPLLIERRKGKSGRWMKPIVHWVLVKSIPPRLRFRETIYAHLHHSSRAIESGAEKGVKKQ